MDIFETYALQLPTEIVISNRVVQKYFVVTLYESIKEYVFTVTVYMAATPYLKEKETLHSSENSIRTFRFKLINSAFLHT